MIIKVCGMKEPGNISRIASLAPDMMGFIFYEGSSRYAGDLPEGTLQSTVPDSIEKIGVFVNAASSSIEHRIEQHDLQGVQLHGDEPPEQCDRLKAAGMKVIKVFRVRTAEDLARTAPYEDVADLFLFDTGKQGTWGGTGEKFDHSLLQERKSDHPYLLSGGIGPDDAEAVKEGAEHYGWSGVDINSKFETEPGIKDPARVERFMKTIRT